MPRLFSLEFYRALKNLFTRVTALEAENAALKLRMTTVEEAVE